MVNMDHLSICSSFYSKVVCDSLTERDAYDYHEDNPQIWKGYKDFTGIQTLIGKKILDSFGVGR